MGKELLDWIKSYNQYIWLILFLLSFIIQITPIKISPWTTIFRWISKILFHDVNEKIDKLNSRFDSLENEITENEKDRIRWEILDFANSCRNGRKHTRDEYQHIITLNTKYRTLLERTHDVNGVFELEYNYIKELYAERLEKNDFLS